MFGKWFSRNVSKVGKNSDNNNILQGNVFNGPVILANDNSIFDILSSTGQYSSIQDIVAATLNSASKTHPLYPEFSATYDPKLEKLVSTPETETAFKNHRKIIKGTFHIDYRKFPYMSKTETPWDYAYRTQTFVELETTAYKEYLGDMEDPFPVLTYSEGMVTRIGAPEFPAAVNAILVSGDVEIPIAFRRIPHLEYGCLQFGNVSTDHGFDLRILVRDNPSGVTVNFTKTEVDSLHAQLLREKLFLNMEKSHLFQILIDGNEVLHVGIKEKDLSIEMFQVAKPFSRYIESLLFIEEQLSCQFDPHIDKVSVPEYYAALSLAASLKERPLVVHSEFDDDLRCDYDHILDEVLEDPKETSEYFAEFCVPRLVLQGVCFSIDKAVVGYSNARINNMESVKKNVRRKRKNIMITMRPKEGERYFIKSTQYWGVTVLSPQN